MRSKAVLILAAILLSFAVVAKGKQTSSAPLQADRPSAAGPAPDCANKPGDSPEAMQAAERDPRPPQAPQNPETGTPPADPTPAAVHLDSDLNILTQKQSELAECASAVDPDAQAAEQGSQDTCFGQLLLNFEMRHNGDPERIVPIGRLPGTAAFFYESGMTIDADGAPNAYHPDNTGLDDLANAGTPGRWEGLAKDPYGEPYIQGPDDPYPGYYVSATALADRSKPISDPTRYVDATKIPFVVLPGGMARELGARPGDFAIVFNQRNGKSSYAIFADVGPFDHIGEGSVALAEGLGIRSDARNGGARRGILYMVFPGSGNGRPRTNEEISAEGEKLLQAWEDSFVRLACSDPHPARAAEGQPAGN
jgi:hypothetical protein